MKFTEPRIFPGLYLTLGGEVVEILSIGGGCAWGRYLGQYSIQSWFTNGRWDGQCRNLRDLVARLPVGVESNNFAAAIRGVWRCVNGQFAEVLGVGIEHATGVSAASDAMRWGTFTGKLIDGVDTGWDLDVWMGFAPADEAVKRPSNP